MTSALHIKAKVEVCLGQAGIPVGNLTYARQGRRESTAFAYTIDWLNDPNRFKISSDLELTSAHQQRKAPSAVDSPFPFALADTSPDAWGRRVILREHAKRRKRDAQLRELTELDFLLAVDDFSRVGALRLRDGEHVYHGTTEEGRSGTPVLLDLGRIYASSRAVETGHETARDLRYLLGKGTSLGGMRPKCTIVDRDDSLAIGKFPSIGDTRSITRGEVLALRLAAVRGIDAAQARIEVVEAVPIAIISRFDRTQDGGRIPYMSAASFLQASRQDEHSYTEIVDAIRSYSQQPTHDTQKLWRRIVFNHLITNVDDHLQNHGFLHVAHGLWRLAPAFDLNPFPDKDRESKTWLSENEGPVVALAPLMALSPYFGLTNAEAMQVLAEVYKAVKNWRKVAREASVGLSASDIESFAPAFEHEAMDEARLILARA